MLRSVHISKTNTIDKMEMLSLSNMDTSSFLVTSIAGLNPPKATINTTKSVYKDGSYFNNISISERNIVLYIDLVTTSRFPTIEDARSKLYELFPSGGLVELQFQTDSIEKPVFITGYVESNESEIFSKKPSNTISILCPDPYFYERDYVTVDLETNHGNLQSVAGTAKSPIIFKKKFSQQTGVFTLSDNNRGGMTFVNIPAGSTLEVSYEPNNRYIRMTSIDGDNVSPYEYVKSNTDGILTVSKTNGIVSMSGYAPGDTGFQIKFKRMYLGL